MRWAPREAECATAEAEGGTAVATATPAVHKIQTGQSSAAAVAHHCTASRALVAGREMSSPAGGARWHGA